MPVSRRLQQLNNAPLYLPNVSLPPAAVWGVVRMVQGYNGPLFRIVRVSDSVTKDIYQLPNGQPNILAVLGFLGTATYAKVDIIYDQTGNGNHITQTTDANRPYFVPTDMIRGKNGIDFDGKLTSTMVIPSTVTASGQNVSMLAVIAPQTSNAAAFLQLGATSTTAGSLNFTLGSGGDPRFYYSSSAAAYNGNDYRGKSQPTAVIAVSGASNVVAYRDESTYTLGVNTAGTFVGGLIAKSGSSSAYLNGEWFATAVYYGQLTAGDASILKTYLYSQFDILTRPDTQLIVPGNSIVQGTFATFNQNNLRQAEPQFKRRVAVGNRGVYGQTAQSQYTNRAYYSLSYNGALVNNLVCAPEPTNDIDGAASGSIVGKGTTCWNSYVLPFMQAMNTAGYPWANILCPTTLVRNWTGSGTDISQKETERTTFNGLVASNQSTYGYTIVDYAALSQLSSYSNLTYFASDGIHPISAGYAAMAGLLASTVNSLI